MALKFTNFRPRNVQDKEPEPFELPLILLGGSGHVSRFGCFHWTEGGIGQWRGPVFPNGRALTVTMGLSGFDTSVWEKGLKHRLLRLVINVYILHLSIL